MVTCKFSVFFVEKNSFTVKNFKCPENGIDRLRNGNLRRLLTLRRTYFVVTSSQYHLRNSDFTIPRFQTVAYGKHSLTYLGLIIWSKLDRSIRSSEYFLDIFKKRIKLVILTSLLDSSCKDYFYVTTNNLLIA